MTDTAPIWKYVIDVRVKIEPRYSLEDEEFADDLRMSYFEDAATMQYPRTMGKAACVADFLRSMADEIERGDLPPGPTLSVTDP